MGKIAKILVVGAGGFIGQHLVKMLIENNFSVTALDIFQKEIVKSVNLEWAVGPLSDETLVSAASADCEAVFYLASSSLPATANADMASEIAQHVRTAIKTAEICYSQGVQKFIFASSGGTVYGIDKDLPLNENDPTMPRNAYGVSKLSIEKYLSVLSNINNIQTLSLRISNPYGELQRASRGQGFIAAAMKACIYEEILQIWGDGNVMRDFIHVSDVARAFIAAYHYNGPSDCINIGSGRGLSLSDCIQFIEKSFDKKITVEKLSGRTIDVQKSVLDILKAQRLLGWSPTVSIQEGIDLTARWWIEQSR